MDIKIENRIEVPVQTIELASEFSEEFLKAVLKLEKECLPAEWQYPDVEEYYREILNDEKNINIFLREEDEIIGYILGRPFNEIVDELKEYDPELHPDNDKFYIETIQILAASQGKGGSTKLLKAACEEVLKRDITKFAIHARTMNKFSEMVKKIFANQVCLVRKIDKWIPANNEPYEYIEWKF